MSRVKAELYLFLVATFWAGTFPIIKTSLETIPPFYFVAIRFCCAAILFYIFFNKHISLKSSAEFKAGTFLAFLFFAGFVSQTLGLLTTTSSNSALITGINIPLVPFVIYFIMKKSVSWSNWLAVLIVVIGLFMLTKPFELGINYGDLLTLICAVSWAFYIIYIDIYSKRYNFHNLVYIQFLLVGVSSLIIALLTESPAGIKMNTQTILSFSYMIIPATLIATYLGNKYQKGTTPIRATIIFSWEQVAAVILSVIFINERLDLTQITGGALMMTGILFSELFTPKKLIAKSNSEKPNYRK